MGRAPTRREQYAQSVRSNLAAELADPPLTLCPRCSDGWVQPNTPGWRMGVCPACFHKAKAEAHRLAAKEIKAQREDEAARAEKSRAMRQARRAEAGRLADSGGI